MQAERHLTLKFLETPPDEGAATLERLAPGEAAAFLAALLDETAEPLARLLRYPEGTAGALMDPRVLALPEDLSAADALGRMRRAARQVFYYLYVVDREQRLRGVLNLRELLLAPPRTPLAAAMRQSVARIPARADRVAILAHPAWREYHALPVVDEGGILLGAIRYETLRRLEAEAKPGDRAGDPLATMVTLGELCWQGMARVLADFAAGLPAKPAPPGSVKGGPDAP